MACDNCYNSSCDSTCGCPQQIKGKCVFYQGANLDCLDVTKGDDYDSILANLNTIVCSLQAPSGIQTTLTGCSSITVTQTTDTNYNVCLSSATQTEINNNTTNIATLSDCVDAGVLDLVSNDGSVIITVDTPSTGCGRILDLSVPTPSGVPIYDGIIYNNIDKNGTSVGAGDKFLKTYLVNDSSLVEGDEIRFRANGQIMGDGVDVDQVRIELYDTSMSALLASETFTGFDKVNKQSWNANCVLTLGTGGDGLFNIEFFANSLANGIGGNFNTVSKLVSNVDVSGIVLTNLQIRIVYAHFSTSGPANNFARQLMIEVRKKI